MTLKNILVRRQVAKLNSRIQKRVSRSLISQNKMPKGSDHIRFCHPHDEKYKNQFIIVHLPTWQDQEQIDFEENDLDILLCIFESMYEQKKICLFLLFRWTKVFGIFHVS